MIVTERLELTPFTAEFLRSSLAGDISHAASLIGAGLPGSWPTYPDTFRMRLEQLEADPSLLPWLLRGMVLREARQLIGHIGFHTGPNPDYLAPLAPGGIELGYTVLEPYRRQGFATEAATGLMRWATEAHGLSRFVISVRPDNTPSLAMAAKLGFRRIGEHVDDVDGLEHVFALNFTERDRHRSAREG